MSGAVDTIDALPALEDVAREVGSNRYLVAVLQLAQRHAQHECGDVECHDEMVAGDVLEDEAQNSPQEELLAHIRTMSRRQKEAAVPFLRRLGYSVVVWHDGDDARPFSIRFPGKARATKLRRLLRVPHTPLHATSPGMLRMRGVMWCIPRLRLWRRRAARRALLGHAPPGVQGAA